MWNPVCQHTRGVGVWGLVLLFLLSLSGPGWSSEQGKHQAQQNKIKLVTGEVVGNDLVIRIQGTAAPAYTVYELFKPVRIVVDVAETVLDKAAAVHLPPQLPVQLKTTHLDNDSPMLTRFELTLPRTYTYEVNQKGTDILVHIKGIAATRQQDGKEGAVAEPSGRQQGKDKEQQGTEVAAPSRTTPTPEATTGSTGAAKTVATVVDAIEVLTPPGQTLIRIKGDGPITQYTAHVLDSKKDPPPRLYFDIKDVRPVGLVRNRKVGTSVARIRLAPHGHDLRVVLDAAGPKMFPYEIKEITNGLAIQVRESAKTGAVQDKVAGLIGSASSIRQELPQVEPLGKKVTASPERRAVVKTVPGKKPKDSFGFSGYDKERITVDFYKIDLHNVFRLLREVSHKNIVVDESVNGSLTLALTDVPWDFALDIILNLKDLQKEERFNTIVILPKNKKFQWPERAEDNLSFETDEAIAEQEAIVIQQQENVSPAVVEARQLIDKGRELEKHDDIMGAVSQYEAALARWPKNAGLAAKISSLYLVRLHQNAKAVFYGKKALELNPDDSRVALDVAIGLANMQQNEEAQQYFDQSVNGAKPLPEAFLSYAAFCEEQKKYDASLKLLKKYDKLHGEDLHSMLATARVMDKAGQREAATKEYTSLLHAGFRVPPDLEKYIRGRIAMGQSKK